MGPHAMYLKAEKDEWERGKNLVIHLTSTTSCKIHKKESQITFAICRQLAAKQHLNFKMEGTGRSVPVYLTWSLFSTADSSWARHKPTNKCFSEVLLEQDLLVTEVLLHSKAAFHFWVFKNTNSNRPNLKVFAILITCCFKAILSREVKGCSFVWCQSSLG